MRSRSKLASLTEDMRRSEILSVHVVSGRMSHARDPVGTLVPAKAKFKATVFLVDYSTTTSIQRYATDTLIEQRVSMLTSKQSIDFDTSLMHTMKVTLLCFYRG